MFSMPKIFSRVDLVLNTLAIISKIHVSILTVKNKMLEVCIGHNRITED
jgi:hypothetical protein